MIFKLSYVNSNLALTLGYLNPALNFEQLGPGIDSRRFCEPARINGLPQQKLYLHDYR